MMDQPILPGGGAMLAAGALLTQNKRVRRGELWAGRPASPMRTLSEAELSGFGRTARVYVERAREYRGTAGEDGR